MRLNITKVIQGYILLLRNGRKGVPRYYEQTYDVLFPIFGYVKEGIMKVGVERHWDRNGKCLEGSEWDVIGITKIGMD